MSLRSPSFFGKLFDNFKNLYDLEDYIEVPIEGNTREIKNIKNKVCRFCKKTSPEVTFKQLPHIIPVFLSKQNWYSAEECDECNSLFNIYETSLSDYFNIDRTIQRTEGRRGLPSFKSPNDEIIGKSAEFYSFPGVYIKVNCLTDSLTYNEVTGNLNLKTKIGSYIPIFLYKSFLKIALSVLKSNEIVLYDRLLPFLLNRFDKRIAHCPVLIQQMHVDTKFAFKILIFKKKDNSVEISTHFFSIYWMNYIISFPLPLSEFDTWLLKQSNELFFPPPLFSGINDEMLEKMQLTSLLLNLNSENKASGEYKEFSFLMDRESLKSLIGHNMDTGETELLNIFDVSKVKGIFISKEKGVPTIYFDETREIS